MAFGVFKKHSATHWRREITRYERKRDGAKNPTQRNYADAKLREARRMLAGLELADLNRDPTVIELDQSEYEELP